MCGSPTRIDWRGLKRIFGAATIYLLKGKGLMKLLVETKANPPNVSKNSAAANEVLSGLLITLNFRSTSSEFCTNVKEIG